MINEVSVTTRSAVSTSHRLGNGKTHKIWAIVDRTISPFTGQGGSETFNKRISKTTHCLLMKEGSVSIDICSLLTQWQ